MTHFATADDRDDAFMDEQLERFLAWARAAARRARPELVLHAANSAATLREPRAHLDLVRCGIAIYGLDPFGEDPAEHGLEPGAAARVLRRGGQARSSRGRARATAGASSPREPTTLATIPIGYADGVRRGLTNNADVLVGGRARARSSGR